MAQDLTMMLYNMSGYKYNKFLEKNNYLIKFLLKKIQIKTQTNTYDTY